MLPENITAILARNERWTGSAATEPYEAGWAREAVIFVRALKPPVGDQPVARVEISPDGMHWLAEGTQIAMPTRQDEVVAARLSNFGNWLRLATDFADDAEATVLVTLHLKA
ncbi:hypothetical protein [Nitratireductor sp. ZSWI3]|uniref:hypothetical protein n=1 Tax=Nitratireductor sp. ZSWI3 TaxID=2966359 RepID=UPI0021502FF4|nr:hypothetical protein [Nitratireductor sp. ZSWI3]MCR4268491.1 hypothetical protein [Nitratireductor sp. ZSWI3]